MHMLKKEDRPHEWDGSRIIGLVFVIAGMVPFLVWLYELIMHVSYHPGDDFNPAIRPKDVWYMVFPAMGLGLGLMFGYGRELVNALIKRIGGKND